LFSFTTDVCLVTSIAGLGWLYCYTQDKTLNNNPATLNYRSVEDHYVPLKIKLLIGSTEAFLENKFSDLAKHN
jgi:hypothetical protein